MGVGFVGNNVYTSSLLELHKSVLDGVFNYGLNRESRDLEVRGIHFKGKGHIGETHVFNADVVVNGTMEIESKVGEGTRVLVKIPKEGQK